MPSSERDRHEWRGRTSQSTTIRSHPLLTIISYDSMRPQIYTRRLASIIYQPRTMSAHSRPARWMTTSPTSFSSSSPSFSASTPSTDIATSPTVGCFVNTGKIDLPNSSYMAYKLWSNMPNPTPKGVRYERPTNSTDPPQLNILAVHGRHDNAGSFDHLIPLMIPAWNAAMSPSSPPSSPSPCDSSPVRVNILCIDLIGHGLSSWRPIDGKYGLHQHMCDLQMLLKELNWREYMFIGHSMGAIIGMLLCGHRGRTHSISSSDSVSGSSSSPSPSAFLSPVLLGCVLLDPFRWENWRLRDSNDQPAAYSAYEDIMSLASELLPNKIDERRAIQSRPKRLYSSLDHARQAYQKTVPDIADTSVNTLLVRGTKHVTRPKVSATSPSSSTVDESGFIYSHDPLLGGSSLADLSREEFGSSTSGIQAPGLCMHFRTEELLKDHAYIRHIDDLFRGSIFDRTNSDGLGRTVDVIGGHHLHLDRPSRIAQPMVDFLTRAWNQRHETRQRLDAASRMSPPIASKL